MGVKRLGVKARKMVKAMEMKISEYAKETVFFGLMTDKLVFKYEIALPPLMAAYFATSAIYFLERERERQSTIYIYVCVMESIRRR